MNKLIFVDLDGTLLDSNNNISQYSKDIIAKAKSLGYTIILSTGKSYKIARQYYDELNLDSYLVTSHGQYVHDKAGNVVKSSTMSQEIIFNTFSQYEQEINCFFIETQNGVYTNCPNSNFFGFLGKPEITKDKIDEIVGVYFVFGSPKKLKFANIRALPWETGEKGYTYFLKPKGISKESALQWIIDKHNFEIVIGFGNGRSDINSLILADVPYAMKNSHESVLDVIKNVTEYDNDNDGVAKEIAKLL